MNCNYTIFYSKCLAYVAGWNLGSVAAVQAVVVISPLIVGALVHPQTTAILSRVPPRVSLRGDCLGAGNPHCTVELSEGSENPHCIYFSSQV